MSKATKITYAILSILAGLTVGVLVALIVGVITTLQALIKFPVEVYRGCTRNAEFKRLHQAFNVQTMEDLEKKRWDEMTEDEKMWERHIQKMENKKHNN
jgi:hypothetical protein